jgi:hypothetical protein
LDIFKEADLMIDFTKHFKTSATQERLERSVIRKRLLISLYGIGTNMGLKAVTSNGLDENYTDLEYIKRKFINKENLRNSIAEVVNATFEYTDNKDNGKKKLLKLETNEFIRRFLLHVLPSGYMKIRYYGILG